MSHVGVQQILLTPPVDYTHRSQNGGAALGLWPLVKWSRNISGITEVLLDFTQEGLLSLTAQRTTCETRNAHPSY